MHVAIAGNIGSGKTTLHVYYQNTTNGNLTMRMWKTIHIWMTSIMKWNAGLLTCKSIF
jgi:ABC-type transport system involved in cytochrome bd biosynthesis fused ATPase/permease subunit